MHKLAKRSLAWLLVIAMCISFLPTVVFAADVTDADSLISALSGGDDIINLTSDITLTSELTVSRAVTIDGGNHTIRAGSSVPKLITCTADLTLKNVTLDATNVEKYALNTYLDNVTLENVTIINGSNTWYGINVNGSTVTATNLNVDSFKFAGVNVDPKNAASVLSLNSGSLANGIYLDDTGAAPGTNNATVNIAGGTVAGIATDGQVKAEAKVSGGSVDTISGVKSATVTGGSVGTISDVPTVSITGGTVSSVTGATDPVTLPDGYKLLADGTVTNAFTVKAKIDGAEELLASAAVHGTSVTLASYNNVKWEDTAAGPITGDAYTVNVADADDNGVITLTGKTVPTHTVKFVADGVTISEQTVAEGNLPSDPGVPAKDGYNGAWDAAITAVGTADVTYTAVYTLKTFAIQAKTNGPTVADVTFDFEGTDTDPVVTLKDTEVQVTDNATVESKFVLPVLTADGWTFAYWTDGNGGYYLGGETVAVSGNATYTAVFTKDQHVVKFVADGVLVDVQLVDDGASVVVPEVPEKDGYTGEWPTIANPVTADATYTAVYTEKVYEVTSTVALDGATSTDAAHQPDVSRGGGYYVPETGFNAGNTIYVIPAEIAGYELEDIGAFGAVSSTLLPVSVDGVSGVYHFTMPAEDVALALSYTAKSFQVTFKAADGSLWDSTTAVYQQAIPAPAEPSKDGYTFLGWAKEGETDVYDLANGVTEDTTFVPLFKAVEYTLQAATNGPAVSGASFTIDGAAVSVDLSDAAVILVDDATVETTVVLPDLTDKAAGWTFAYWTDNNGGFYLGGETIAVSGDATYTAVFTKDEYVVKFVADGVLVDVQLVKSDEAVVDPGVPAKAGYTGAWDHEIVSPATENATYTAVYQPELNQLEKVLYIDNVEVLDNPVFIDGVISGIQAYTDGLVTYKVTAPSGYQVQSVAVATESGVAVTNNLLQVELNADGTYTYTYQFAMPAEKTSIEVRMLSDLAGVSMVKFVDAATGYLYDVKAIPTGTTVTLPADPEKTGYEFDGWFADATLSAAFDASVVINDSEVTVYAGFTAKQYQVIYSANGGSVVPGMETKSYGETAVLPTPVRDGYEFLYWETADGARYGDHAAYTVTDHVEFVAQWAEIAADKCIVKFYVDNVLYDWASVDQGSTFTAFPTAPDKAGYEFVGWENSGNLYTDNVTIPDVEIFCLNAKFNPLSYTVTYDANGGSVDPTSAVKAYGETAVLPTPVRDGYEFLYWETADGARYGDHAAYTVTGDVTFTAQWAEKAADKCIVKFYVDNDLYEWVYADQGSTFTAFPTAPVKEGNEFVGWENSGNRYTTSIPVPAEEVFCLNAAFDVLSYAVSTQVTPLEVPADNVNVSQADYAFGSTVTVGITVPEGYYFDSIAVVGDSGTAYPVNTVSSSVEYQFTMPAENVKVIVNYKEIPADYCMVNFIVNGTVVDSRLVKQGDTVTTLSAPVVEHKTFQYWRYSDGLANVTIAANKPFEVPEGKSTLNVYAFFADAVYTVNFDLDGGRPDQPARDFLLAGDTITLPAAPTKEGHSFIGWRDSITGFVYGERATYEITGNATLTAVWAVGEYVIRFLDEENHTIVDYQVVSYGAEVTAPAAPETYGKHFTGWQLSTDAAVVVQPGNKFSATQSADYVAAWEVNTHNISTDGSNVVFTGVPANDVAVGDTVNFTAEAATGYALTSVVLNYTHNGIAVKEELGVSGSYSFTMPDSDVTITAAAKQTRFHVSIDPENVTILGGPTNAIAGSRVTFKVVPAENYVVQNVFVKTDDTDLRIPVTVEVADDGSVVYSFTMPEEDVTICADGVKGEFTVTYVDFDNTYLGAEIVKSGEQATAAGINTSREGYQFDHWISLPGGVEFPLTTSVTGDLVLKAVYEGLAHKVEEGLVENVHSLTAWVVDGSAVDFIAKPDMDLGTKTGDVVRFTVAAKYNYEITGLAVVSTVAGSNTVVEPTLQKMWTENVGGNDLTFFTYTFTMPDEDVKIDIYTQAKKYMVAVTEDPAASGDFTINGFTTSNLEVAQDELVTIPVQAIDGWYVASYEATYQNDNGDTVIVKDTSGNDLQVTTTGEPTSVDISFKMVAKPVTVKITYAPIGYTVTCANVANGTITADPTTANVGDLVSVSLTPAPGYKPVTDTIRVWAGNTLITANYGGRDDATGTYYYQFTMPASDVTVTADFEENIYEVEAETSYVGGTVYVGNTNTNVDQFKKDQEASVTVIPDAGYRIALKSEDHQLTSQDTRTVTVPYFQLVKRDDPSVVVYDSWEAAVDELRAAEGMAPAFSQDVAVTENNGVYTFIMPEYDLLVVVGFEKVDQNVTVKAALDGTEVMADITVVDRTVDPTTPIAVVSDVDVLTTSQVKDVLEVTLAPREGYRYVLDSLVMYGAEDYYVPIYTRANPDGTYVARFVMPAESVTIEADFEYDTYRVTGVQPDNGEITVTADPNHGSDKYYEDFLYKSTAYADVTADAGYYIASVTAYKADDPTVVVASYTNSDTSVNAYQLVIDSMPNYNVKVEAVIVAIDYTVTVNPALDGDGEVMLKTIAKNINDGVEISVEDLVTELNGCNVGERVRLTITAKQGYVLTDEPIRITKMNGGSLDDDVNLTYTQTVTGEKAVATFTMPARDVLVNVSAVVDSFTVTGKTTDNCGEVEVAPGTGKYTQDFDYKSTASALVTAKEGYYITDIQVVKAGTTTLVPGAPLVSGNTLQTLISQEISFQMPNYDVEVIASFAPITYADQVDVGANGSVAYDPASGEFNTDSTAVFVVTPDHGYAIDELYASYTDAQGNLKYVDLKKGTETKLDTSCNTVVTAYTFTQPAHVVTVHATFKAMDYSLTSDYNAAQAELRLNNMDTTATTATYTHEVRVDVKPESGYQITKVWYEYVDCTNTAHEVDLTADFTDKVAGGTTTFTMPCADVVVKATFDVVGYSISYDVGPKGTVDPAPASADYKSNVRFVVKPDAGYEIDTLTATYVDVTGEDATITLNRSIVSVDPVSGTAVTNCDFVMPDADVTVHVTFKPLSYTDVVRIEQGDGTSIMNGIQTVRISAATDSEVVVIPVPDVGFEVQSITAETAAFEPVALTDNGDGSYSFIQPADEVIIVVKFVQSLYTISYNNPENGVIINKTLTAKYQDEASFQVVPDDGYEVLSVTATYVDENGKDQSIVFKSVVDGVYTFTMPAADVQVTVLFTAETFSVSTDITGNGTVQLNGNYTALESVLMDSTVTINAVPDEGYEIASVTAQTAHGDDVTVTNVADGEYTFQQPADDVIVTVVFVKQNTAITTVSISYTGEHANIVAPDTAAYDSTVLVTVEPDDGYRAAGLSVSYTDPEGEVKYAPVSLVKGDEYYNVQYAFVMPACMPNTTVEVTAFTVEWSASVYDDVRSDDWYYTAVNFVSNRGYFQGIADGIFAPNMNMNRAMFVTVLGRIAGINPDDYTSVPFNDVDMSKWYGPYVAWAAENGIVLGYDADTFKPMENITREQMAAIMYRYCEYAGLDTTIKNDSWMNRYTDADQISNYAVDYVRWAVGIGLIKGMTDTTINPKDLATRAQVAQVIKNLCDKVLYR